MKQENTAGFILRLQAKEQAGLELSEHLKELGVKQDGIYSYFQYDKWNILLRETKEIHTPNNECSCNKDNLICSAFTVAELVLPYPYASGKDSLGDYICWDTTNPQIGQRGKTEADARAKMRIYLIKSGLMEANE